MANILSPEILTVLCVAAFLVGAVNAAFGVGGSLLAYPILLYWLPDRIIIGVLSVIVMVVTTHRILLLRRALSAQTLLFFLILGFPAAIAGAFLLAHIDVDLLRTVVGFFLIAIILQDWSHNRDRPDPRGDHEPITPPKSFIVGGAASGFLTGLIGSAGVINTALLLRAGFTKEAISVNQAGIALAYSLIKLPVYWKYGILTPESVLAGVIATIGSASGTLAGSYILRALSVTRYVLILRFLILLIGGKMVVDGLWPGR